MRARCAFPFAFSCQAVKEGSGDTKVAHGTYKVIPFVRVSSGKTPPATRHGCDGPLVVWGGMRLERLSAGHADAVDLDARATTVDYQADQLALTSLNVDPVGDTAGRPTLAVAPELVLPLNPAVASAVTGAGPDQGLRTYYVVFDKIVSEVDVIGDERWISPTHESVTYTCI